MYDDIDAVSASSPLQTSVRNAIVESQQVLSKEDFLKLMLPDSLPMEEGRRKVSYFVQLSVSQIKLTYKWISDIPQIGIEKAVSFCISKVYSMVLL